MKSFCNSIIGGLKKLEWFPLLAVRLILAFGFLQPALMKVMNFSSTVEWFSTLGIPAPYVLTIFAMIFELLGVVLLTLGLFTRLITLPLMAIMVTAITFVHWEHGFKAANNGFEIPLYYLAMLVVLFVFGPGGVSIDCGIKKRWLVKD